MVDFATKQAHGKKKKGLEDSLKAAMTHGSLSNNPSEQTMQVKSINGFETP